MKIKTNADYVKLLFIIVVILNRICISQTEVSGNITENTTWNAENSPYIVVGDLNVTQGDTLIIEPGVTVKFNRITGDGGYITGQERYRGGAELNVQGTLIAIGTSQDILDIKFTSNETIPVASDWGNIRFDGPESGGVLKYCSIEYAMFGIYIDDTSPPISYNIISNCNSAIKCIKSASPQIDNNTIISNYKGIISYSTPTISNNQITGNESNGIVVSNYKSFITGNTISLNLGSAIDVEYGEAELFGNIIINNFGSGIQISDGSLVINNCIISNNNQFGIGFSGPGNLTITNCAISNNSYSGIRVYGSGWFEIIGNKIYGNGIKGVHQPNTPDAKPDGIYFYTGNSNVTASIHNNNIYQNVPYNIYNDGISNIDAEYNWWGTSNEDSISSQIWDFNDDFALGTVDYEPWLGEPYSSVGEKDVVISGFVLSQNYPNPFNTSTTISYKLPKSSFVKLSIYDINGRLIEKLVNDRKNAGYYTVEWNADNVSSGIYFYRIEAINFSKVKKCLVVK